MIMNRKYKRLVNPEIMICGSKQLAYCDQWQQYLNSCLLADTFTQQYLVVVVFNRIVAYW